MNGTDWLRFELYVMDLLDKAQIRDSKQLMKFADNAHQQLELAIEDYANDEGIEDYDPVY